TENIRGRNKDKPFFLFVGHHAPHLPRGVSAAFKRTSGRGLYGDAVSEFDWSVGEILKTLKEEGISDNTLVIVTSDNGPWYQGSPGRLRGRKGSTGEGGTRVPFVARLPGVIPAGSVCNEAASIMDVCPTLIQLAGAPLPGKKLDGIDIWPMMKGEAPPSRPKPLLYFSLLDFQAARVGKWKLHVARYNSPIFSPPPEGGRINLPLPKPELYDLEADPGETMNCAEDYPETAQHILGMIEAEMETMPAAIQEAYKRTKSLPVEDTPAGADPVLRVADTVEKYAALIPA
ncbi:MAG: sulfatase-like hydrolase/transferase, partial [Alphaproteobacteria bacterium]|nr:sulfatase-like hydrolase/transferase [Alphaproteobacteria bacterium]